MRFMSYLFHLVRREIKIKEIDKKEKKAKDRRKLKKERRQMTTRKKACKWKEIPGKRPKERKKNKQIKWRMKE